MRFIFDFIIILILLLCAYWMYVIIRSFFIKKNKKIKTKLWRIIIVIVLILIFGSVFYGSFIEPQLIKVKKTSVNLNKTPETETIKIAFITDLHVGPYKQENYVEKIVKKTLAEKPDLILLGGDFLYNEEQEAQYLTPIKQLAENFPVFAVTGNHEFNTGKYDDENLIDRTKLLRQLFTDWEIQILDTQMVPLTLQNKKIDLYGVEDLWTERADLKKLIDYVTPNRPNILLSHNPDIILDPLHAQFDLIISGHTHAGQIRLPYIGSIPGVPTQLGRKYDHGLFKFDNNYLYISAGLGESGVRARFFDPPELSIINLDL